MHAFKRMLCLLLLPFALVHGLDDPPQLECLNDSMRMHFVPDEDRPFNGHVYVKGLLFLAQLPPGLHPPLALRTLLLSRALPLGMPAPDSLRYTTRRPADPAGQSYSIVLIVQHHPLFLTENDKAYSLTCFYRDEKNRLEQKLEISDITTSQIQDEPTNPDCSYEVLRGEVGGQVVKFASIGDILVHKWTYQGILVHSCIVRDGLGNEFPLLDERGCITDGSLIQQPLTYTPELNTCFTPINAFKFADQMLVYFSCQITLCRKAEQGCEGITPPVCEFQPLPEEGGAPMPTVANRTGTTAPLFRTTTPSSGFWGRQEALQGEEEEEGLPLLFRSSPYASSRHARSVDPRPPAVRSRRNISDLLTVDVQADSLIIFTKDENPALSTGARGEPNGFCPPSTDGCRHFHVALLYLQHRYFSERLAHVSAVSYELGFVNVAASAKSTPQHPRRPAISAYHSDPFANH
ncbi:Zona pellucida domain-containing protein [Aphelenchoides fujianensis]|nr:Zona pellucida domain-containing protein [Aphelenchoides fujianensis]